MDENSQAPPPSPAEPPSEFGPLLLHRGEHPISRRDIDPDVLKIINRLHQQGFTAYLVGGAVRDLLLGRQPKDFDVVTDARPGQIKKRFRNAFLIGRRFRLAHVHFSEGKIIEVATFRRDLEPGQTPPDSSESEHVSDEEGISAPSRHVHEHPNIYGTPAEDAFRRDTTINALFYDTITSTIIDYVGGLEDMARRKVRIIGNPAERLTEDPVRVWRVIRQAARLGFDIEETTEQAIPGHRHLVGGCAPSRLYEELNKEMAGESRPVFEALGRYGILGFILGKIGQDFETESAVFSRVLNLLEAKDAAAAEGQSFTPEELYSLLFWPWVEPLFAEPQGDMHAILKEAVSAARTQAQLPKALQAGIIQTLIIIGSMTRALRTGRMRWSLKERPHYGQASRLTFLIDKGRMPGAHESFVDLFRAAFPGSSTKPRRRRRRHRPGPRPPAD
jgi:poly(A) polymerase